MDMSHCSLLSSIILRNLHSKSGNKYMPCYWYILTVRSAYLNITFAPQNRKVVVSRDVFWTIAETRRKKNPEMLDKYFNWPKSWTEYCFFFSLAKPQLDSPEWDAWQAFQIKYWWIIMNCSLEFLVDKTRALVNGVCVIVVVPSLMEQIHTKTHDMTN